jgi:hypothetical protein
LASWREIFLNLFAAAAWREILSSRKMLLGATGS